MMVAMSWVPITAPSSGEGVPGPERTAGVGDEDGQVSRHRKPEERAAGKVLLDGNLLFAPRDGE